MASWTGISALHVLLNTQFRPAGPTKNRFLTPFTLGPDFDRMIGQRSMAIFACIINSATLHLDRNNVSRPVPMPAPGLRIEIDPAHFWKIRSHVRIEDSTNRQQFFVEPADLPGPVHKVDLKYPVPLPAGSIQRTHPVGILGMHIKSDLVPLNSFVRKFPIRCPAIGPPYSQPASFAN